MPPLLPDHADRRFLRRLVLAAIGLALLVFVHAIGDLLLLAFGAVLGAVLLSAVADRLVRHARVPRGAGLAVGALALFGVLGAIGWLFGSAIASQGGRVVQTLPHDWAVLQARLAANPIGHLFADSGKQAAGGAKAMTISLNAGWGAGEIAVNFILVLIGALFFAADPGLYVRGLVLLAPPAQRPPLERALADVGRALRLWLYTQLISMLLMGAMIAGGLWLSGVESWAALGVLGGLSEFIPYVGPTLAMIPAIVAALAGHGSVLGVFASYAIVRLIQANLITPLISQRVVAIPPALYLFGIIAMGAAFSTFGLFFSGALVVAAFTLVRALYLRETLGEAIPPPGHSGDG